MRAATTGTQELAEIDEKELEAEQLGELVGDVLDEGVAEEEEGTSAVEVLGNIRILDSLKSL